MWNELAQSEKAVVEKEKAVAVLKDELDLFTRLYKAGTLVFEKGNYNPTARKLLDEHRVTAENYNRIMELITANESEIAELETSLTEIDRVRRDVSETLSDFERIISMTFVDKLIQDERNRRTSEIVNGVKLADLSFAESQRIDVLAEKAVKVVEEQGQRSYRKL